jgi:bridging integrator 3
MNWPFSKPVVKQNIVPRMVQKDFEKEEKKIKQFEETNKKLYKDVKRYIESIDETNKSELKLINNILIVMSTTTTTTTTLATNKLTSSLSIPALTNSTSSISNPYRLSLADSFNNKITHWKQTHLSQNQNYLEKLKLTCQYDVIEPMKKLNLLFPSVYSAIKRREKAYQDFEKEQQKLLKFQEKERLGDNLVKINQHQQLVNNASALFQKEHLLLMEELPKFYDSRINYIYPCIQQLIKSQIEFFSSYSSNYEKLLEECNFNQIYKTSLSNASSSTPSSSTSSSSRSISSMNSNNENQQLSTIKNTNQLQAVDQVDADIKRLLGQIKSLSIVASD